MTPAWPTRLLMVGCGNMGGAMLAGWLRAGLAPSRFTVVDPGLAAAPAGVDLRRALPGEGAFDAVLVAIKPQLLDDLAPALAPLAGPHTTVLSILAGVECASLAARFPQAGALVRIMPNLAAAIGASPMGLFGTGQGGAALSPEAQTRITALLAPLGTPEWLADEDLLHAVTALAGSGPAFVYRFIDALATAGVALGLGAEQAQRLATAMVEGGAMLAASADVGPGELARRVASPGGTTQKGLDVLDADAALARLVTATLTAARDRSREMAAAARAG